MSNDNEAPYDPLQETILLIREDPKYQELRQALMNNYVYMGCFNRDPLQMAFNEGMREMAAMICGINEEVREWLEKATKEAG
jgi:hypothetical protein